MCVKVLPKRFHKNDHTIDFGLQSQKLKFVITMQRLGSASEIDASERSCSSALLCGRRADARDQITSDRKSKQA